MGKGGSFTDDELYELLLAALAKALTTNSASLIVSDGAETTLRPIQIPN